MEERSLWQCITVAAAEDAENSNLEGDADENPVVMLNLIALEACEDMAAVSREGTQNLQEEHNELMRQNNDFLLEILGRMEPSTAASSGQEVPSAERDGAVNAAVPAPSGQELASAETVSDGNAAVAGA
ncbi:hypothetical protein scyTo_0001118 [Scyliorhinus torazame]|uniref:Uncharacterized protein n=1 Tax=Scyliorhinus torazame TaxID=75743 RepID=A0A401P9E3_SCYTO|nr:hypothetical protein [Scyliorhinus torazame]